MLAIIGGTGLYELDGLDIHERQGGDTPFGTPSGEVLRGTLHGQAVLFLARHGAGHRLLPHEVNYRANVYALKRAGATMMLGFSAVGSLVQEIAPGDLAAAQWVAGAEGGEGGIDETVRQVFVAPLRNAQPSGLDHLAGALADIVDRRRLLIGAQIFGLVGMALNAASTP